jgi:NAD(P)-dependent dehydrogenase (short-subunit alcohol dehydrogenase family)
MRLRNKVAMVTGGASGIGTATAGIFAREGARVAVADVDDAGQKVAKEIESRGGQALFVPLDVTNEEAWDEAVQSVVKTFGRLDVLVNCAGIALRDPVDETVLADWEKVMAVNSTGVFLGTRAAARAMKKQGDGSVINISSIFGLVGNPVGVAYPASKGAVKLLTKSAAIQLGPHKVRVNSICPTYCETPLTETMLQDSEVRERLVSMHPLGRLALPEDIAYGAVYLASDEACFVTGSELVIDGGFTAR